MKNPAILFATSLLLAAGVAFAQTPNDAQIAAIVVAANQVDINAGKAYHEQVIDAIKTTLIPNAKNEELKSLLEKGSPLFEGHLEHAKQIQATLPK